MCVSFIEVTGELMRGYAKGDRGNEVVDIQVKLAKLGYDLGLDGADGCFGEITENAVLDFQASKELPLTGYVDEDTWRNLVEASYTLGDRLLYLRSPFFRGNDIKELQLNLNTLGFNTGHVDGIFGQTTERALREFQYNYGLPSDGIFGPSTHAAISNLNHILKRKESRIFPDPKRHQASVISVFDNVHMVVDLAMARSEGTVNDEIAEAGRDLGLRLGNLLELLGANVDYQNVSDENNLGHADICVGFGLNSSEDTSLCGSVVLYRTGNQELENMSRALAEQVQSELVRVLGSKDLGVHTFDYKSRVLDNSPTALIKPLFISNSSENSQLNEEIFRQKIAVAVFDGIKSYLQKH